MLVFPLGAPPIATHPSVRVRAPQINAEAHLHAAPQKATYAPAVHVASYFTLSKCVNLTLYGVAMVTGWIQSAPEAKES